MESSNALSGQTLVQIIIELTGLPKEMVHQELIDLLKSRGISPQNLTLDTLREAMFAYLEQVDGESRGQPLTPFESAPLFKDHT